MSRRVLTNGRVLVRDNRVVIASSQNDACSCCGPQEETCCVPGSQGNSVRYQFNPPPDDYIDFTADTSPILQAQNIPTRDYLSNSQCDGLVSSTDSEQLYATQYIFEPTSGECHVYRERCVSGTAAWTVSKHQGGPSDDPSFFAKQQGLGYITEYSMQVEFWPAYVWPSGLVTPRFVFRADAFASAGWPAGGSFQGWGGNVYAQTKEPTNLAALSFPGFGGAPNGYTGLQMEGASHASFSSACGGMPAFDESSSVTGGIYADSYGPDAISLRMSLQWAGLIDKVLVYPWWGPSTVSSFARFSGSAVATITPVAYCNAPSQ